MRYFIDCEFDGYRGPLISMALVREDGRSLYFVIAGAEDAARDPWVITNVLPILRDAPEAPYTITPEIAAATICGFLGDDEQPHIVADWPDDLRHFCDLVVYGPGEMIPLPSFTMEVKRVDAYPTTLTAAVQHNAWWDALALRQKVLEMEDAAGHPEPGPAPADGPRPGDVCCLIGGGVSMTVADVYPGDEFAPPSVSAMWMSETNELQIAAIPVAALRLRRSA